MIVASDHLGNPVSTANAAALAAIDDFGAAFLACEARAADILKAPADGALIGAYVAALCMLMESPRGAARARPWLARAEAAPRANARELATIAFVRAWAGGDIPAALGLGGAIVAEWPRDLVTVKLHQYLAFNTGDLASMLTVARASAAASADVPQAHGLVAFALEETHRLAEAEAAASRALEMTPREPWAQHALAHVMLAQGRIDEGARFMGAASAGWTGLNSFMMTHNWWHLALFHISQGRGEAVLGLYDDHCWAGDPDYSQDQIGAVSLLARLEFAGVDVGERWADVADRLAARGADTGQPFLALQYLYGLARAGRPQAAALLAAIRERAGEAPPFSRAAWADAALPTAEGIAAHLAGDHAGAVAALDRAAPHMGRIGGSHAQRDLFEQIRLAALLGDGQWERASDTLEARRVFEPDGVPLNRALVRVHEELRLRAG